MPGARWSPRTMSTQPQNDIDDKRSELRRPPCTARLRTAPLVANNWDTPITQIPSNQAIEGTPGSRCEVMKDDGVD